MFVQFYSLDYLVYNVLAKVNFLPVPADFAWLNYALVGFVLGVVLTFFVKENK